MKLDLSNKTHLRILREELNDTLREFVKNHGLHSHSIGAITYRYDGLQVSFKVSLENQSTDGKTKAQKDFELSAPMYGLKPSHWNSLFLYNGNTYRICGIKPRSRKYPILGRDVSTGKTFKFASSLVVSGLGE